MITWEPKGLDYHTSDEAVFFLPIFVVRIVVEQVASALRRPYSIVDNLDKSFRIGHIGHI